MLAALLISAAHVYTESHFLSRALLLTPSYLLRVPFLFVVAMFFGHLVQDARGREREVGEARARERRMEFLSAVSHDLKNPLGVIQLLATTLLEGDAGLLNAAQTDLVRRLHASARHVTTLALNLIDAARIDAGHLVLHRRPVAIGDIVEDALVLARSATDLKGIRLECSSASDLPTAEVDPIHVERMISNLLGNAIKFTPSGGAITLSVRHLDGRIVLRIEDTGPGIPAEEMPTLFEKYRQRHYAGSDASGLGLFIVKAIVEAHGGGLDLDSQVGRGTTVTVRLPVRAPVTLPEGPGDPASRPRWWQQPATGEPRVTTTPGRPSLRATPRG